MARRIFRKDEEKPKIDESPEVLEDFGAPLILRRFHEAQEAVRHSRKDFWLNSAFFSGHQWVFYNKASHGVEEVARDEERVQATINRMLPLARTQAGKITQRGLTFEVPSTKADDANIRGARTAESAVAHASRAHDWNSLRDMQTWAILKGGVAAVCIDWNPDAGEAIGTGTDGAKLHKGDTIETVLNVAQFLIQPGVPDAYKAHWWIKVQALSPEVVKDLYDLNSEPPADVSAGMNGLEMKVMGYEDQAKLTQVLTYYERPHKSCPKGRVAVIVDGHVVGGGVKEWPFPWSDHLNVAVSGDVPKDDTWMCETTFTSVRPLQVAYNAVWSSIIEHIKLAGNARLAIPQSNMDLVEQLTDLPGEVLPYLDGTTPPQYLVPAQLPAYIIDSTDKISAKIDDLLGVHEVSRGTMPTNIESGYGLSILAENDATPSGRIIRGEAVVWSRIAQMYLQLVEKYVKEQRETVVTMPGLPAMTQQWSGRDLLGQTDAQVPEEAIIPRSAAAQQAMADKMMSMGLIKSVAEYVHIAELPGQKDILAVAAPDVEKARRENHRMRLGEVCIPADFDNHTTHIQEHNIFRKSAEFDLLDDKTQEIFNDHIQAHSTLASGEIANQYAKSQMHPLMAATPTPQESPTIPVDAAAAVAQGAPVDPASALPPDAQPGPGDMPAGPASGAPVLPPGQAGTLPQ